jgi:Xaa-Pro aminopeptidase
LAKQKSAKDKSFGKLSLDEKVLILFLKSKKLEEFHVSTNLEALWFQFLKKNKFTPVLKNFSVERRKKTQYEIACLQDSQDKTEKAFEHVKKILQESKIDGSRIVWFGQTLTSELLKFEIKKFLLKEEWVLWRHDQNFFKRKSK